jgi:hypothetical protein
MMKRLKTMLAEIKPSDTFLARHDDDNVTLSGSEGVGEGHLRHAANLRASHTSERRRHERARRRTHNPGAAVGQVHPAMPRSHRRPQR